MSNIENRYVNNIVPNLFLYYYLQLPDPVDLALYANGIMMYSGPFRPFTDPQTQHLIKDILDGYFPSELQARYPDGIPFVVSIFIINPFYSRAACHQGH